MADINNINIDTNNYTIDILEQPSYEILLNGQGPQGARGYTGNGISSINLTSTSGNIDTYTITYTDGQTSTFDVTNGLKGQPGDAATISVGSVTTGEPDTSATVVNSGTSNAAIFDFTIPKGAKGDTGDTGSTGPQGVSVTGVALQSTVGLDKTYRMSFSDGTYFDYVVSDGTDGGYTLPVASASTLGGIKVGSNLSIDANGVLSATAGGTVTSVNNVQPVNGNVTISIPTVPTNISAFTNDSGYITSSALNGYATQTWVTNQGYITSSSLPTMTYTSTTETLTFS